LIHCKQHKKNNN